MAILRVRKGSSPGAIFTVHGCTKPTVLGRDAGADITVDDERVSRKHCRIFRAYGSWILQDLGSGNGTILAGERVDRQRIDDGATIQVGDTVLSFHPGELAPVPTNEIDGFRLLTAVYEEAGVVVYRALETSSDREVRVDVLTAAWRLPDRLLRTVTRTMEETPELDHPGIDRLIRAETDPTAGQHVALACRNGELLGSCIDRIQNESLRARLEVCRSVADVVLSRASRASLLAPFAPRHITLRKTDVGRYDASISLLELPALMAQQTRSLCHLPGYVSYLSPELVEEKSADVTLASVVYAVGAVAYQVMSGTLPMGNESHRKILENHRTADPAPLELVRPDVPGKVSKLLERMLSKDPEARPSDLTEILRTLEKAARDAGDDSPEVVFRVATASRRSPETHTPPPTPPARVPRTVPVVDSVANERPEEDHGKPAQSAGFAHLLEVPLWVCIWALLFFIARYLSRYLFLSYS